MIFSSDNGGPVRLAENAANNWPLRGGQGEPLNGEGLDVVDFLTGDEWGHNVGVIIRGFKGFE